MKNTKRVIVINEDADNIPTNAVSSNESHFLDVKVNVENGDAYLNFSSRLAMYDFARSLLHEAVYGYGGQMEFYALEADKKLLVVNGVRMSLSSSRLFVFYDDSSFKEIDDEHTNGLQRGRVQ